LIFVVFLLKKQKKMSESLPVLAVLAYLVVYVLFGSQPYGWYAFPFWPMLFVIMARFLDLTISKGKNYIFSFFMILMILGGTLAKLINIGSFQKYASLWRISLSLTLLIMTGVMIGGVKSKKMSRVILLILLTVLFYGNVKYLNGMTIELWWNNIS